MARRLIVTPTAVSDLQEIAEYIGADSPYYATEVARSVFDALDVAKQFPRAGREVPELEDPDIRELIVYSYRVIYHLHENDSVIRFVAVIHGARDLRTALAKRKT